MYGLGMGGPSSLRRSRELHQQALDLGCDTNKFDSMMGDIGKTCTLMDKRVTSHSLKNTEMNYKVSWGDCGAPLLCPLTSCLLAERHRD